MKLSFEGTLSVVVSDMREFLATMDGDGADDAAEAATGTTSTRKKRETKAEKQAREAAEAAATAQAATGAPQPTFTPPATATAPAAAPQPGFGQPATNGAFAGQPSGVAFPAPAAAPEVHPLAKAIVDVIDKSVSGGQPAENVLTFFRPFLGPDGANATLDQLRTVFIPRLPEATLKQIAPQVGIAV